MKKIVKKSCTFLFVFAMLLSMFCVSFSAETYYYDKNFEFYKNDYSGLTITDYLGTEENLQIPSQLIDITGNVIAPSTISDKTGLVTVSMPDTIQTIGAFAFSNCTNITDVKLSKNLSLCVLGAFQGCTSLETVDMSMTKVTGLPNQMFYKCSSLKNVTLPETCTSVGSYAFANCPKLESVYIPASVTEISDKAFKNSSAVTIKGIVGSYAEEYAKANNIPFEGISAYDVGDVNMDGRIDILDATLIQKYVAGIVELSAEQKYLADYINDGDITVVDATKIQKFIVHLN